MRILSLSSVPLVQYLGSGKTRLNWTEGLKNLGHSVDVLQPSDFELWPSLKKARRYRFALGVLVKVRILLKKSNYDIIEYYGDEYWLLLWWLKKIKKSKNIPLLVAHADGLELLDMDKEQEFWNKRTGIRKWLDDNLRKRFSKINFNLSDRFVCGCFDDLNYAVDNHIFSKSNAVCIAPGIEESFHEIPFIKEKKNIIIFIGSWIDRKGITIIPTVVSKILTDNNHYRFHVFGAWHSKTEIMEKFNSNIIDQISVFDKLPLDDLLNGIMESSILFFPSYSEGFGLSTIEAMSCSCAIVTTKTGIGSQLANYKEAIICDFNDTNAMIKGIQELIDKEDFKHEISFNGYKKAKEFKWPDQVKKLEAIYNSWCNNKDKGQ